jgi:hypothetical protein
MELRMSAKERDRVERRNRVFQDRLVKAVVVQFENYSDFLAIAVPHSGQTPLTLPVRL